MEEYLEATEVVDTDEESVNLVMKDKKIRKFQKKLRDNTKEFNVKFRFEDREFLRVYERHIVEYKWEDSKQKCYSNAVIIDIMHERKAMEIPEPYLLNHPESVLYEHIVTYIKDVTDYLQLDYVFINGRYFETSKKEICMMKLLTLGFIRFSDVCKDQAASPFLFSVPDSSEVLVLENKKGILLSSTSFLSKINEALEKMRVQYKTSQLEVFNIKYPFYDVRYYHQGFEGKIRFEIGDTLTVTVMKLLRTKENIQKKIMEFIEEPFLQFSDVKLDDDIPRIIENILLESEQEVQLKNLIEPPRKHFLKFYEDSFSYMYLGKDIPDKLFLLLADEYGAAQLEEMIMTAKRDAIDNTDSVYFFELLNFYFVVVSKKGVIEKFKDKTEGIERFRELALEEVREKYELSISELDTKIKKMRGY